MKNEQEQVVKSQLLNQLKSGQISRRQFMQMMTVAGLGLAGVNALGAIPAWAQDTRPLTPTIYQWMIDLHPGIPDVNTAFGDVNQQIAPVAGFDTSRFVAEAKVRDEHLGFVPGRDAVCRYGGAGQDRRD